LTILLRRIFRAPQIDFHFFAAWGVISIFTMFIRYKSFLWLVLILGGLRSTGFAAPDATRVRLEQMATNYNHFVLETVIRNRPLRLRGLSVEQPDANGRFIRKPNPLAEEQSRLLQELRSLDGDRPALTALLKHPDPKVRTLALGSLFQREDGRDLPLIASLMDDPALTLTNLHNALGQGGGSQSLTNLENAQTVGDIAREMLAFWGVPHDGRPVQTGYGSGVAAITANDFAAYWEKYQGRKYAAQWFAVRMNRATRETEPLQPEYQADTDRVLADIRAVPGSDGLWIQMYVLAPGNLFPNRIVPDDDLIPVAKKLDPDALLRFLQRKSVSDDPGLQLDQDDHIFVGISDFILDHADQLLRPKDCDALLDCQYVMHDSGGVNPAWVIGASLVEPARAGPLLHAALAHETRTYVTAAGQLAGALWRIRGPAELDFLVNWFYTVLPSAGEPMHQPVAFLWGVEKAARPDTKQLLAALVKDPRFDHTDWPTLVEMLKLMNTGRAMPVVSEPDIYDAQPNGLEDVHRIYPEWRNRMRHEYGLPEEPLPAPPAAPEQVLTQPAWSAAIPAQEDYAGQWRLVPSPDGRSLALLSHEVVTIWQTDTGKLAWQPPSFQARGYGYPAVAGDVAFTAAGQLLTFDHGDYGRFRTWDPATHKEGDKISLSGKPHSGVDGGRYSFDHTAQRMAFAGYNDLGCFDTRTGAALWLHPGEGGVNMPVALSADGSRLAAGGGSNIPQVVRLYDAVTGERLRQFDSLAGPVLALALSGDGRRLVTATAAGGLQLWDAGSGKLLQTFAWQVPAWDMGPPAFSTDDRRLAVTGSASVIGAHEIGIFDTDTGRLKWLVRFQTDSSFGPDTPLAFSPDGTYLYTAAREIQAWSLK
jgi:hypothetical protein